MGTLKKFMKTEKPNSYACILTKTQKCTLFFLFLPKGNKTKKSIAKTKIVISFKVSSIGEEEELMS